MKHSTLLIIAACCIFGSIAGCARDERTLTLAVSTEEPAPAIAEAVRTTLNDRGFKVSIETATDPADAMLAISERRIDIAIVEEPHRTPPGVMTLVPLYPSVLHVLHKQVSEPAGLEAVIRGAKIYAGPSGGAADRLLTNLARDFDVPRDAFEVLDYPWPVVPDVYFVFGGLLSRDSIAELSDYQLFSFGATDAVPGTTIVDGIVLRHHNLRPFILPEGVYGRFSDGAVLTLSTRSLLIASDAMDDELAYDIAETLFKNARAISEPYPLVARELSEELGATDLVLPLHEGSRRYLDRDRPGFIERNAEVIALYFTIVITALSGLVAAYRYRAQVKKDRVDAYFTRLIEVRQALSEPDADRAMCRQHLIEVQREVLELLIDERITADSSLLAFVIQSNQMLNELDRPAATKHG